ncbi:hypothetical plasmid protein [Microbacterium esteraromaticum]|uniref:Hypothetical plasmid protein n=1 Tax=Microbacterium esteraromaticum TaxID=57043 RepID=A0A1R4J0S4_9MICO|nr:DUF3560 domain-containing protein [Microbacterium esteraromaticum]SJN25243.1 hypothetical plasmid protein [Microbacterium esteraromaticum]
MLTITHTHEAGTIIEGTAKGDGTAAILKANRWRWGRSISAWYVPNSRDRLPQHHVITRTAAALEAAGFELETLQLDMTTRSTAEVEAAKAERQAARVDALDAKAERKTSRANELWQKHERDVASLPEGGEPIKIGHHSERRHRNAIDKAHNSARRGIDALHEAEEAARRAEAAAHTTSARYNPVTVANRIEKIAADIRRWERQIDADVYDAETGYRPATEEQKAKRAAHYAPRLDEMRDQLAYWQQVRDDQIASGQATGYSPETVKKGDAVKIRGTWYKVARANAKTVSVETPYSWTDRSPWAEVQDHRAATSGS